MLNWDEYSKEEVNSPPITPEMKEETTAPAAEVQQPEPPQPCLLYTSPSPRDATLSRMPSSA